MGDERIFGLVAMLALLFWLLAGRGVPTRHRRTLEYLAYGILAAGILYALFQTAVWLAA